jgi:aldose 1-epimerase
MGIKKTEFGTLGNGSKVHLYTLSNGKMSFSASDFGCTITSIIVPDKNGNHDDIVLGYSTLDGYVNSVGSSFGTVIGRYANRIGGAQFKIGKDVYRLDKNDGDNCLHSGFKPFEKMIWQSSSVKKINSPCSVFGNTFLKKGSGISFVRTSSPFEQGFPGNFKCTVTYLLTDENELVVDYCAECDKETPVNITNHTYFNLGGCMSGSVDSTLLTMKCSQYLEVTESLIPTGRIIPVKGTAFDFTEQKKIGRDIAATGIGYDHCYATPLYEICRKFGTSGTYDGIDENTKRKVYAKIAEAYNPQTGRRMEVETNQEGVQLYTANWINGIKGKNGRVCSNHDAFCLETQCFPDTPNKTEFPSCILVPPKKYWSRTVYRFFC